MTRFALFQALSAFLAIIPTVSTTPLIFGGNYYTPKRDGEIWPASVAGEAHDTTWPNFTAKTSRWSSFEAPTFNEVFLPRNENDLSLGVSKLSFVLETSKFEEICRLNYAVNS